MATVTGFTATRMLQIENGTIVDGEVDVNGDLILERKDGTLINAGSVIGPQGPSGPQGDFSGYVEPIDDKGNVAGTVTLDFSLFNVFRIVPTAAVTIAFANLPTGSNLTPGTLIVANSTYAITWPVGTKFNEAAAPELDGETWLSLAAQSTHVTVGRAWSGVA